MTKDQDFSRWIDFAKGVAIFEIVMFHFFADHGRTLLGQRGAMFLQPAEDLIRQMQVLFVQAVHVGSQGIHIFFFMSGLGLAASASRGHVPPWAFIKKRFSRIYPALAIAVVAVVILQVATGQSKLVDSYPQAAVAALLLVQNYSTDWIRAINGNWWFVGALLPMYLTYLALREKVAARPMLWAGLFFMLSLAYKIVLVVSLEKGWFFFDAGSLNPYTAFFLNYVWEFFAGVAFFRLGGWRWLSSLNGKGLLLVLAAAAGLQVVGAVIGRHPTGRIFNDDFFAVSQVLAISCLFLLVSRGRLTRLVASTCWLGTASYGLYLIHQPVSRTIAYYDAVPASFLLLIVLFLAYFAVCLGCGRVIDRLAERFATR